MLRSVLQCGCALQRSLIMRPILKVRCLQTSALCSTEGTLDKTTMTILNEDTEMLLIDTYSQLGFRMNKGMVVLGSMAIFRRSVLSWAVHRIQDVTPDSLVLFHTLEPKLDIVLIGMGDASEKPPLQIKQFMQQKRISCEILPTDKACATFNFLNSEGRNVAAALIPPTKVVASVSDMVYLKARRRRLFLEGEYDDDSEYSDHPMLKPKK